MDSNIFNSWMISVSLVTVSVGIIALLAGLFYFVFDFNKTVNKIEQRQENLQDEIGKFIEERLKQVSTSNNSGEEK